MFVTLSENCTSFDWTTLDLECVDDEILQSSEPGALVLCKHGGVRYGDGYLCFSTYAVVFTCRLCYGPYNPGKPVLVLPPLVIGEPHQVILADSS